MESTVFLFERCTVSMKSSDDHCLQVLRYVISNFLESIACYSYVHNGNMSILPKQIEAIQQLLQSWLSSYEVVGGNMFGSRPVKHQSKHLLKSSVEVQVTQYCLFIHYHVNYNSVLCTPIDLEVLSFC